MMDMKEFISLPLFPLLCGFGCSEFCWLVFVLSREFTTYSCSDGSYKKYCVTHMNKFSLTFCTKQVFLSVRDFWRFIYYFCAALDAVVVVLLLLVCEQPTNQPTIWSRSTWNAIIGVMFLLLFQLTRRMF